MKPFLPKSIITLALLGASQVFAGGLWLNEFGDFAAGRATAGAAAGTDEASTIIHNPASATGLDGSQLFASAGIIIPKVKFDTQESLPVIGDDSGGQAGKLAPGTSLSYVYDTGSDKWSAGVSVAGLAGAGLNYNGGWVGRYQVTDVDLLVMALAPMAAYQLTDSISIGVAPQLYYASLEQKLRLPTSVITDREDARAKLDGDDTGFGGMVGVMFELSPDTRLGVSWQSEYEINFDGDLELQGNIADGVRINTDTEFNMAQYLRAALHHDLNDRLGLDFTVGWDDWSVMDSIFVAVDTGGGAPLAINWKDTYHYAAGFQYRLNDDWDITSGIAYDTSPVDAEDRVAYLPVDRQIRYNIGARYHLRDTLVVGGYANYTDLGSAKITGDFWRGKYSSNEIFQFSLFANWLL